MITANTDGIPCLPEVVGVGYDPSNQWWCVSYNPQIWETFVLLITFGIYSDIYKKKKNSTVTVSVIATAWPGKAEYELAITKHLSLSLNDTFAQGLDECN